MLEPSFCRIGANAMTRRFRSAKPKTQKQENLDDENTAGEDDEKWKKVERRKHFCSMSQTQLRLLFR